MQLPANLQTGRVEGFFALEILDGPDFDDEPEVIPAEGDVLFTANIPYWPAGAAEMIIVKTEKVVPLVNGWITIPGSTPPSGMNPGVRLFATDDPDYGVVNWQWTATPRLRSSTGVKLLDAVPPIKFNLPAGETINLARVAETPLTVPAGIVQSESNAAAAASAAQRAAAEVERLGHLIETEGINSGGGLNISGLLLADPEDIPEFSYSPIEVWGGTPTIPGSEGWYREKRVGQAEVAPGANQASGPLDMTGSSFFSYPGVPNAIDWSNNPGRVIITELKPGGDAQWAHWLFNLEFVTSSPEVELFVNAAVTNGKLGTILVNGKRISERSIRHTMISGAGYGIKMTFPSAKERTIRINALNSGTGRWGGVAVQPGFDVKKSAYRPNRRFAVIGDSYVNGTNEVSATETFIWRLANLMGADELLQVGIGGTGFHNTKNNSTFIHRVPAVLDYAPDVLFVAGGRNDPPAGLQAAVEEFLQQVTSIKEVYLISTASDRGQAAVNDALKAGAEAAGRTFVRGDVDFYPTEDTVHLTYESHQAFADELFVKMLSTERDGTKSIERAIGASGTLAARDGHAYQFLAGVIRNEGDGWKLIQDATHRPINIDSVETISDSSGGSIRINYQSFAPNMVGSVIAAPDETFAGAGFTFGTSVAPGYTDIKIGAPDQQSDYVYYDGTKWVSQKGVFTGIEFANGKLTLQHKAISQTALHSVNVIPRGQRYDYAVSNDGSSFIADRLVLEIRDNSPEYADSVHYDGTKWISQTGVFTGFEFTDGALVLTHPNVYTDQWWRVSVSGRGQYDARLSRATAPTNGTTVKIEWVDAAGAVITEPVQGMQAFVIKGGGRRQLAPEPHADMKFFVTHGQGSRHVDPATITTEKYPSSNIWIFGVAGIPDIA